MYHKNNLKYFVYPARLLEPLLAAWHKENYQLGLHLRRFFLIHKCFRIYSINGIQIQRSLHPSVNPRTFIWVQNIHSKLWIKNLWIHDKTETFWFQIHESAFYRLSFSFWPLFLFQQLLKKKKRCGTRQFHTPFFSGVFWTFTARCFWTITFFFTLRFTLTFSGTITFCLVAFLTVLASISFT